MIFGWLQSSTWAFRLLLLSSVVSLVSPVSIAQDDTLMPTSGPQWVTATPEPVAIQHECPIHMNYSADQLLPEYLSACGHCLESDPAPGYEIPVYQFVDQSTWTPQPILNCGDMLSEWLTATPEGVAEFECEVDTDFGPPGGDYVTAVPTDIPPVTAVPTWTPPPTWTPTALPPEPDFWVRDWYMDFEEYGPFGTDLQVLYDDPTVDGVWDFVVEYGTGDSFNLYDVGGNWVFQSYGANPYFGHIIDIQTECTVQSVSYDIWSNQIYNGSTARYYARMHGYLDGIAVYYEENGRFYSDSTWRTHTYYPDAFLNSIRIYAYDTPGAYGFSNTRSTYIDNINIDCLESTTLPDTPPATNTPAPTWTPPPTWTPVVTVDPNSTPGLFASPTPDYSVMCSMPEMYLRSESVAADPLVEFNLNSTHVDTSCYTVFPGDSLNSLPGVGGLHDVWFCFEWYEMPGITLFGISIGAHYFVVFIVAFIFQVMRSW